MNDGQRASRRVVLKYNEDDILGILSEYLANQNGFDTFQSNALLIGEAGKDLRLVIAVGDIEDDDISKFDLREIDEKMDFNGTH